MSTIADSVVFFVAWIAGFVFGTVLGALELLMRTAFVLLVLVAPAVFFAELVLGAPDVETWQMFMVSFALAVAYSVFSRKV